MLIGGSRDGSDGRAPRLLRAAVSIALGTALIVALFAATALAAKPKPGDCWGRCGGPEGPIGGYFRVAHNDVIDFEDSDACLGTVEGFKDYIDIPNSIPVTAGGQFSWNGMAGVGDGVTIEPTVIGVSVSGHFTTRRTAKVTLQIEMRGCSAVHLKIHRYN
jgi:hypothetical protein